MRTKAILTMAVVLVLAAGAAVAQEMEPRKYEGDWYEIHRIDFKPGGLERALEIIEDHFAPAAMKSGSGPPELVLVHRTGSWGMTVVWKLEGGPADLAWEISPDDVKWMAALAESTGGQEAAMELFQEFESLTTKVSTTLARSWAPDVMAEE